MGELPALNSLLHLLLLLIATASSSINIQAVVGEYSALTFYLTPLQNSTGVTVNITVSYIDPARATTVTIYSSTVVLAKQSKFSVWNFEATRQTIDIDLESSEYLNSNMLRVDSAKKEGVFVAALDKDTSSGYMLPFNMLNLKTLKMYVIAFEQPVQLMTYNLEPFMSTYWTEMQSSVQLMPHLPYLSQCELQKSFVLISDVLQPSRCSQQDFFGLECEDKQLDFQCVLQELEVSNVDAQFWFNNGQSILYYLFPNKFSLPDLYSASENLAGVGALILTLFDDLVPVYYSRRSPDPIVVNDFYILFKVAVSQDSQGMRIVYAEIEGHYDPALSSPNASVHVHVSYLNIFQRFNSYDMLWVWYVGYALLVGGVMSACIWLGMSRVCAMRMREKIKHVLAPAVKGCLYTMATGGCFFVLINEITYRTDFSSITALYGSTLTDESLQMNNIGRNGLAVVVTGFYLMTAALKQACKVHSEWELKIVLEDDSRLQRRGAMSEEEVAERIQFTKKNLVSHEKFVLICSLLVVVIGLWYADFVLSLSNAQSVFATVLLVPLLSKILNETMKHFMIKELLYVSGNLLGLILTSSLIVLKGRSVAEFTYLYFSRFLNLYVQLFLLEVAFGKLLAKLDANSEANRFTKLLSRLLHGPLEFRRRESQYERALYVSSLIVMQVVAVIMLPLVALTIYLLGRTTLLESQLLMGAPASGFSLLMLVSLAPLELATIFALVEVMKRRGVRVQEVIKFSRFRFRRRKFRWMNDEFSLSRNIHFFYREYDKFAFSSQLYFVVSLLGFSGFLLYLGLLIVLESSYMLGNDPVVLIVLIAVVLAGDVLSFVVSFAALKLRLYEKREEEVMRQSLLKTEKYLRNSDIADFLPLQGVKDYFLLYNCEWIIHNLPRIFDKEDFEENAGELVAKYKHYKSIFKKRQIDERRRIKRLKENSVLAPAAHLPPQPQIALPRRPFLLLARPIAYYWLFLARQSLYLKAIVGAVRTDKLRKNCEFCNMDVQLEALQRRDFQQLVNEFRLLNVSRPFDAKNFLEFYRLRQKYVTVCVECKEKNLHMENKITMKETASKLVKRWHLVAKSSLLHRNTRTTTRNSRQSTS